MDSAGVDMLNEGILLRKKNKKMVFFNYFILVLVIILLTTTAFITYSQMDFDADGLSNGEELKLNTDPRAEDTSGDGVRDKEAVDHWMDPTVKYPDHFVNSFSLAKAESEDLADKLALTLLHDDNISKREKDFLALFDELYRLDERNFYTVSFSILKDYKIAPYEFDFLDALNNVTRDFQNTSNKLVDHYLEDQHLSNDDSRYLSYLDDHFDIKYSLLSEGGRLTSHEFNYIEVLSDDHRGVKEQILPLGYHQDGMISWQEDFLLNDRDLDGLITKVEMEIGTKPFNADTDDDGKDDGLEYLSLNTDPTDPDTDSDMISDGTEIDRYGTDPLNNDTDGDGLTDGEEVYLLWSDPTLPEYKLSDIWNDLTKDGKRDENDLSYIREITTNLHNIKEQIMGRDYHIDGSINRTELDRVQDPDSDGLITALEVKIGTDPYNPDTDGDGLFDGWEVYGYKQPGRKGVPLNEYGADPLRKDIFIEMIGREKLSVSQKKQIIQTFKEAPVSNPDGTTGIDIHIDDDTENYSLGGENPGISEYGYNLVWKEHPRYGVFYFCKVIDVDGYAGTGRVFGYNFQIDPDYLKNTRYFTHELGHNILGNLDPENILDEEDKIHSKYVGYGMYKTPGDIDYHPNVWNEIDRDGILGLPPKMKTEIWQGRDWMVYYGG